MNTFISRVTIFLGIQPKYNMLSAKYLIYSGWIPRKMFIYKIANSVPQIEKWIVLFQELPFFWEFNLNISCWAQNIFYIIYKLYTGWIPRKMVIYEITNTLSEIEEYIVLIQKLQFFWEFILNKICTAWNISYI